MMRPRSVVLTAGEMIGSVWLFDCAPKKVPRMGGAEVVERMFNSIATGVG